MKEKNAGRRALWIVIIPVMLVLAALNVGLPQRFLTGVTVGNETYTVAAFNYYFYTEYYDFINDNADNLPFDLKTSLKNQDYDENTNWQEHFHEVALERLEEVSVLYTAALTNGYQLEDEEREEIQKKQDEIYEYCADNSMNKEDSYYTTLYDAGMTKTTYFEQFERTLLADKYKEQILTELAPSADEIADYIEANLDASKDYEAADVGCIYLEPETDRDSNEVTDRQWNNCEIRAENILEKWNEGGSNSDIFSEMATAYSQMDDVMETGGIYKTLILGDLPEELTDWYLSADRVSGDTTTIKTDSGIYILYYDQSAGSANEETAKRELTQTAYNNWLTEQKNNVTITIHQFAMTIAR